MFWLIIAVYDNDPNMRNELTIFVLVVTKIKKVKKKGNF